MLDGTTTATLERPQLFHADFSFFMEKAPDNLFQAEFRFEEFLVTDASGHGRNMVPLRVIGLGVKAFAPFFSFRNMLHEEAACHAIAIAGPDGDAYQCR